MNNIIVRTKIGKEGHVTYITDALGLQQAEQTGRMIFAQEFASEEQANREITRF